MGLSMKVCQFHTVYTDRNRDITKTGVTTAPACLFSMFPF